MGIKDLTSYLNNNIKLTTQQWKINKDLFYKLRRLNSSNIQKFTQNKENKNVGNINIIVDAKTFYYHLGGRRNWFVFNTRSILNLLKNQLLLLLSINNLNKLIFVFEGINTSLTKEIKKKRQEKDISKIIEFYNIIQTEPFTNDNKLNSVIKFCPYPWVLQSFYQYLKDAQKIFPERLEVRVSPYEHDGYIAKLANEIEGYVISDDSDFFIYDIPKLIRFHNMKFPYVNSDDHYITSELYTREILMNYFNMTKETLPIFATLCSNDYLIVENFSKFFNQISEYPVTRDTLNHIQNDHFKKVANFILDMCNDLNINRIEETLQNKQMLIIDEVMKRKEKEEQEDDELDQKFKNNLIDSVHEYNLTRKENYYNFDSNIICNDIIESYYSGNIINKLLEVIINKSYECNAYLENVNRNCCWNITNNLRKQLYKLLLSRNNAGLIKDSKLDKNKINNNQKYIITELIRKKSNYINRKVEICVDNQFPETQNEQFSKYLEVFHSNIQIITKLPYYLQPITTVLRFLLIEKIKSNLFISNENDKTYKNLMKLYKGNNEIQSCDNNNDNKEEEEEEEPQTSLYWYEFESLIASCIAALTFTFLNKKLYQPQKADNSSFNKLDEKKNDFGKISNKDCQNMFFSLNHQNSGNLQLKTVWGIENFQHDRELYENAIQIHAEFCSILFLNSNFLQTLKIMETQKKYLSFFSMYHYVWEEAFYSMMKLFKTVSQNINNNNNNHISDIFNQVFLLNSFKQESDSDQNNDEYINYLQKMYYKVFNAIIYTPK